MPKEIPPLLSSVQILLSLLTRRQKLESLTIILFALAVSILEVLTALSVVSLITLMGKPGAAQPYLSQIGIDSAIEPNDLVFYSALACGSLYLIKNILSATQVYYQNAVVQRMNYRFKGSLLKKFAQVDYSFFVTRSSARGLAVVEHDVEQMFSLGIVSLAYALTELMAISFLLAFCVYLNPKLALFIVLFSTVLVWIILKIMMPYFYRHALTARDLVIDSNKNLLQFLQAFKDIIVLGKSEEFINRYREFAKKSAKIKVVQLTLQFIPRITIETLFIAIFILIIWYMTQAAYTMQEMIVLLGGYLYVCFRLMPGINRFINYVQGFKTAVPHIERVYDDFHNIAPKESYLDIPEISFNNEISLKNVNFRHHGSDLDCIKEIDLNIKKGECIGIIGKTGAGKSTLVDLILGLLIPTQGETLIDGLYPANAKQWHKKVGYVSQSLYLVDDSIRANIAFGCDENEIDDDQVKKAIKEAQLVEFIENQPNGIHSPVGERGVRTSGGERQRIAIARALYNNPEVLIFDEATSALDTNTEEKIIETIRSLMESRTVLMIAHRVTTLKHCSRIIELENGTISRVLSYQELVSG